VLDVVFLATSSDDAPTQFLMLCNIFRTFLLSATRGFAIFGFTTHRERFSQSLMVWIDDGFSSALIEIKRKHNKSDDV
jgi:hypothetical protein